MHSIYLLTQNFVKDFVWQGCAELCLSFDTIYAH